MRGPSGSWRSVAAWAVLILVATTVPAMNLVVRAPALWLDKFVHGGLYLVLGWLVGAALCAMGRRGVGAWFFGLLALAAFAFVDEAHQQWLPTRVASRGDWAADVVGATIGLTLGMILWNVLQPRERPERAANGEES
ncbi:MAG: VanZ family protein [Gemmatimonadales bacterium]